MEYAVDRRQNGTEQAALEGAVALRALDQAVRCTACHAPKPAGAAGFSASYMRERRSRTAATAKTLRVLCGSCSAAEDVARRGFKSPAERRARLAQAERELATLPSSRRGGAMSLAARRAWLKWAERDVAAWRRSAR